MTTKYFTIFALAAALGLPVAVATADVAGDDSSASSDRAYAEPTVTPCPTEDPDGRPCPTATPTETPIATPTETPTATPTETATPEPTETPEPTDTPEPEPTDTPEPEPTPDDDFPLPPINDDFPGGNFPPGSDTMACSSQRIATWRLLARSHRVRISQVRVSFEGERLPTTRSKVHGRMVYKAQIDLSGLTRGLYVGHVRYVVTNRATGKSRHRTKVHFWRVCYGKRGAEGPNASTTTIL